MEAKAIISLALVIVAAILISNSECVPLSHSPVSLFDGPVPDDVVADMVHLRQARQYFGGYPGYGLGGFGGLGGGYGGSSASAVATSSSSSGGVGGGYPFIG